MITAEERTHDRTRLDDNIMSAVSMQLQRHTKCGVIHSSEAAPSAGSLEEHHAVANSFSLLQANKEVTLALQPAICIHDRLSHSEILYSIIFLSFNVKKLGN